MKAWTKDLNADLHDEISVSRVQTAIHLAENLPAMLIALLEVRLEAAIIHIRMPYVGHTHAHFCIGGAFVTAVVIVSTLI